MTLLERAQTALVAAKAAASWLLLAGVLALSLLLFGQCRARRGAEDALVKAQDAAAIDRAGLIRGHEVEAKALQAKIDELIARSDSLARAYLDAKAKLDHARPVAAVSASTGPVPVKPEPGSAPEQGERACALYEGDEGEIEVGEVQLETQAGNRVVVGSAEAFRSKPRRFLFGGAYSAPLTTATQLETEPAKRPGWGAGPLVGVSGSGLELGAVVATPEGRLPILGGTVHGLAVAAGGSGRLSVSAALVWRP